LWRGDKAMVDEDEPVDPINVYGLTKARAEQRVLEATPDALVVRTNFFCHGLPWRASLSDWAEQQLRSGTKFKAFTDTYFTPIEANLLSRLLFELIAKQAGGILHVAGRERLSKYDFVLHLAKRLSLDASSAEPGLIDDAHLKAIRPKDMSLSTQRITELLDRPMPSLNDSLEALLERHSLVT
jgi:dTDP-4-dehydrorhamnose reductase